MEISAAPDLDAVANDLAGVAQALERLDGGTYGRCQTCDSPIGDAILEADPLGQTCEAHLPV